MIEFYACNGNLENRELLDNQKVSQVHIWALTNLNKEKKGGMRKKETEY